MPQPRRKLQATAQETMTPPSTLEPGQFIARIKSASGNNLYNVETADSKVLLVELESRFRSTIWLKRGGYVLVDTTKLAERDNKIEGEIVNVVRDERRWRKMGFWPEGFGKRKEAVVGGSSDDEEDESNVGKMPPSEDEEEDD